MITDYVTLLQTSTSSARASEVRSTRANFLHRQSLLLVPQGTNTPTPDTRTDAGSPSNEASNESDPGKHQDATAVPGSDVDADTAEDVLSLLPIGVYTLLIRRHVAAGGGDQRGDLYGTRFRA